VGLRKFEKVSEIDEVYGQQATTRRHNKTLRHGWKWKSWVDGVHHHHEVIGRSRHGSKSEVASFISLRALNHVRGHEYIRLK
jgi:hypothetical protein